MPKPAKLTFFDDIGWVENPQVPHGHWQVAVANGDTQAGYMEYVVSELEAAGRSFEFDDPDVELEVLSAPPELSTEIQSRFPQEWWAEEVAALDTRRGYAKWAAAQQQELDDTLSEQADQGLALADEQAPPSRHSL